MALLIGVCVLIGISLIQVICNRYKSVYSPLYVIDYTSGILRKFFAICGKVYAKVMSYITFYPLFEYILLHYRRIIDFLARTFQRIYDFLVRAFRRLQDFLSKTFRYAYDLVCELCDAVMQILTGILNVLKTPVYALKGYYDEISTYRYTWLMRYLGWGLLLLADYLNEGKVFEYYYESMLTSVGADLVCNSGCGLELTHSLRYLAIKLTLLIGLSARHVVMTPMCIAVGLIAGHLPIVLLMPGMPVFIYILNIHTHLYE